MCHRLSAYHYLAIVELLKKVIHRCPGGPGPAPRAPGSFLPRTTMINLFNVYKCLDIFILLSFTRNIIQITMCSVVSSNVLRKCGKNALRPTKVAATSWFTLCSID